MKRKEALPILLAIVMLAILSGCATGTKGKLVSSYELAGITLTGAYDTVKPVCDIGQLPADKCAQIKKLYNDARGIYLFAGEALIIAVETDDLIKRQAALTQYQSLVTQFTKITTDLISLLIQLGVIQKGGV